MEKELHRYKIMSYITGSTLLMLFVMLALHKIAPSVWSNFHLLDRILGMGHGLVLYPIYLVTCFQLFLKAKMNALALVAMLLAGFVPGLAFVMERWNEKHVTAKRAS